MCTLLWAEMFRARLMAPLTRYRTHTAPSRHHPFLPPSLPQKIQRSAPVSDMVRRDTPPKKDAAPIRANAPGSIHCLASSV